MVRQILGAKGGGGGSNFITKPDTLRSNDSFELLFGLGSGRWKGLTDGLKGLKVNGVPLENTDGSSNFEDVAAIFADGNPLETQTVKFRLGGGGDVQNIGVQLANPNAATPGNWVVGATSTPGANHIDMRFVVQQLFKQDSKSIRELTANIEIQMRPSNSSTWVNPFSGNQSNSVTYDPRGYDIVEDFYGANVYLSRSMFNPNGIGFKASNTPYLTITGKTTSAYVKEVRIAVPNTGNYENVTWEVRARLRERDTLDNDENQERRTIAFESVASVSQEVLGEDEEWRGQVWLQLVGKASDQFNGFPEVTGVFDTKICSTPPTSVWDPETRVYSGETWAGNYEEHFTTDPAWQIKEFIEDPIHGLAGLQPGSTLDKWDCLEASKYFSEQVSDGRGGTHARFNMNLNITEAQEVTEMLQYLAGSVNSYIEDTGDGKWRLVVDKPETPKVLFFEGNTFGGFNYSHTDVDSRFNDWRGTFLNEDLDYEQDTVRVFDQPDIDENGTRFTEVALVGCTNRQEALRRLMFRLRVSLNEYKIVSFVTNRIGRYLSPLDTILVADEALNADHLVKSASRIASYSGTDVVLMRPVRLEVGVSYVMHFNTEDGVVTREVVNLGGERGDVTEISIDSPLPANVLKDSAVSLEANGLPANPISYRVLSVERSEDSEDEYTISAAIIDSGKWNAMDNVSEQAILAQESNVEIDAPGVPTDGMFDLLVYSTDYQVRRALQVNWDRPGSLFLEGFRVEYRYNDGPWKILHENLSDSVAELEDPQDGFYSFKITALDRRGVQSNPLVGQYEVVGSQEVHPPAHIRGSLLDRPEDAPYAGFRYTVTDGVVPVTHVWDGNEWKPEGNLVTEGSHIGVENGATVGMTPAEAARLQDIEANWSSQVTLNSDVAQDLEDLQEATSENASAILAEANARVTQIQASADSLNTRIDGVIADVDATDVRIDGIVSDVTAEVDRVDSLVSSEIARVDTLFDSFSLDFSEESYELEGETVDARTLVLEERSVRSSESAIVARDISALAVRVGDTEAGILSEQQARIDGDGALTTSLNALTTRVGDTEADILSEQQARIDGDGALTTSLNALTTRVGDTEADILSEQQARIDGDSALTTSLNALTTRVGDTEADILSEQQARADGDSALTTSLNALTTRVGDTEADILSEQQARVNADGALTSNLNVLSASLETETDTFALDFASEAYEQEGETVSVRAAVLTEQSARASKEALVARDFSLLTTRVGDTEADILSEQQARINGDGALTTSLNALTTRVGDTEADILSEQQARADGDSALTTSLNALTTRVGDTEADILSEQQARINGDGALTTSLNALTTRVGDTEADILSEQQARTDGDTALATDFSGLNATFEAQEDTFSLDFGSENFQSPGPTKSAEALVLQERSAAASANLAISRDVYSLTARVGDAEGAITAESEARADDIGAVTSSINSLSSRVGDAEATITTYGQSIDGLRARAGVRINANGRVTGWEANDDGDEGNFIVTSDNFEIEPSNPTGPRTQFKDGSWRIYSGSIMTVWGTGFGSSGQFLEWTGPASSDLSNCTENTAIKYVKVDGSAYFGGTLSAGVLKNAATSTSIASNASISIGPFASQGDPINVVTSYSIISTNTATYPATSQGSTNWENAVTAWGATATGSYERTVNASKSISCNVVIKVSRNGVANWATLNITSGSETISGRGPLTSEGISGNLTYRRTIGGTITSTDNVGGTTTREFTAVIETRTGAVNGTIQSQTLSLVATEE